MTASSNAARQQSSAVELSDADFEKFRSTIKALTGINMGDSKKQLVQRRLSGRLAATASSSFSAYLQLLRDPDGREVEEFTNAVTTNLTSFFREKHHFEFLEKHFIPELPQRTGASGKRLRIWSAGCSTGEEPYSIAITLQESMPDLKSWDARVLCTDIDSQVLDTCRRGVYAADRIERVPSRLRSRWFQRSKNTAQVRVNPKLQELLTFKQLNLMGTWPMRGRFDLIFCRNVIIYFDKETQRRLIARFADTLSDGGYLILGHSESLYNVSDRFSLIGQTVYRKEPR